MPKAVVKNKNGLKWLVQGATGRMFLLDMNDEWTEIVFRYPDGKQFGEFYFRDIGQGAYKLIRMYTEPHKREGLGRAALQMFKELTGGMLIYVNPNDSIERDDQSHLTEDAPGFVEKMIAQGLIDGYGNNSESVFFDPYDH